MSPHLFLAVERPVVNTGGPLANRRDHVKIPQPVSAKISRANLPAGEDGYDLPRLNFACSVLWGIHVAPSASWVLPLADISMAGNAMSDCDLTYLARWTLKPENWLIQFWDCPVEVIRGEVGETVSLGNTLRASWDLESPGGRVWATVLFCFVFSYNHCVYVCGELQKKHFNIWSENGLA